MPPITPPIEIRTPESGHISTSDSGQRACPQTTVAYAKLPDTLIVDKHRNHKQNYENEIKLFEGCYSDGLSSLSPKILSILAIQRVSTRVC